MFSSRLDGEGVGLSMEGVLDRYTLVNPTEPMVVPELNALLYKFNDVAGSL